MNYVSINWLIKKSGSMDGWMHDRVTVEWLEDEEIDVSINQSINQSIDQSIFHLLDGWMNE